MSGIAHVEIVVESIGTETASAMASSRQRHARVALLRRARDEAIGQHSSVHRAFACIDGDVLSQRSGDSVQNLSVWHFWEKIKGGR